MHNDEQNDEHNWNKRDNKINWGMYVVIGSICIALAWLLGGR